MSIASYYKERDKLFVKQKMERGVLLAYGIAAEDIDKLHHDDYETWKADRIYVNHNTTSSEEVGEEALSLVCLRRNPCNESYETIGSFLDSIENDKLLTALKALDQNELAMVEACLINGIKQKEYAVFVGKGQAAVSKKLTRIKVELKAALENNFFLIMEYFCFSQCLEVKG